MQNTAAENRGGCSFDFSNFAPLQTKIKEFSAHIDDVVGKI